MIAWAGRLCDEVSDLIMYDSLLAVLALRDRGRLRALFGQETGEIVQERSSWWITCT